MLAISKSAFIRFGNVAIFNKWLWIDAWFTPIFFAILSWGMPRRFMRNILMSLPIWVAARRSAMYESTVRLARPMAFPISAELRLEFPEYARRAVSLASSSLNCFGPNVNLLLVIVFFYLPFDWLHDDPPFLKIYHWVCFNVGWAAALLKLQR